MKLGKNFFVPLLIFTVLLPGVLMAADGFILSESVFPEAMILLLLVSGFYYMRRYRNVILSSQQVTDRQLDTANFSQSLIKISPDSIVVADENLHIVNFNPAAEVLLGYAADEAIDLPIVDTLISADDQTGFYHFLNCRKNTDQHDASLPPVNLTLLKKDGSAAITFVRMVASVDADRVQYIFHIQDKSTLMEAENKLHFAIYNDELTGLPNRHMATQHIHQGVEDAKRNSRHLVVMKIGLDRYKHINDSLGHDAGDKLLVKIAARLKESIRRGDLVSRINGDQFVITLVDVDKNTNLDNLVRNYLDGFKKPFCVNENSLHVSVSIGIACYPEDTNNVDGLLRNAESAMFEAKKTGGNSFQYYSREMRIKSKERLYLENQLRNAIGHDELDVFYQPQVDLLTGKIVGVEALARWTHPQLGIVSPIEFIPLAEEIGLISEIGQWVMSRACTDMALVKSEHGESLRLSINLSAHQFQGGDLVKTIADILNESRFSPDHLELEITESLFVEDVENVANTLNVLSEQGIRISMDDFGTGYSSLSYLKRFPINTIKIDRSFVNGIPANKDDSSIVLATIKMAHSLSLDIVAEGVETEDQLRFLLNQKCDKIQGYYFSRPLSYQALVNLIHENRQIELHLDKICLISGRR